MEIDIINTVRESKPHSSILVSKLGLKLVNGACHILYPNIFIPSNLFLITMQVVILFYSFVLHIYIVENALDISNTETSSRKIIREDPSRDLLSIEGSKSRKTIFDKSSREVE